MQLSGSRHVVEAVSWLSTLDDLAANVAFVVTELARALQGLPSLVACSLDGSFALQYHMQHASLKFPAINFWTVFLFGLCIRLFPLNSRTSGCGGHADLVCTGATVLHHVLACVERSDHTLCGISPALA
jgi:hypothetical protein